MQLEIIYTPQGRQHKILSPTAAILFISIPSQVASLQNHLKAYSIYFIESSNSERRYQLIGIVKVDTVRR